MKIRISKIVIGLHALFWLCSCQYVQEPSVQIPSGEQTSHKVSNADALYVQGRYHQSRMDYTKASEAYLRLLEKNPKHAQAHNALGVIFAAQGNFEDAIRELTLAIATEPQSVRLRNNLGFAYLLTEDYRQAIPQLEIAVKLDPEHQQARNNLDLALERDVKTAVEPVKLDPLPIITAKAGS